MVYIYEYDIAAVFIALAVTISFLIRNNITSKTTKSFFLLSTVILCSSVFDLISLYTIKNAATIPLWINHIINVSYILTFNAVSVCYFLLIVVTNGNFKKWERVDKICVWLPFVLDIILIVTTPFSGTIFYFDENYIYCHGPLFYFLYVVALFYIVLCFAQNSKKRSTFSKSQRATFYFYFIASCTALIIQMIFTRVLIIGFVTSLTSMFIYLTLENPASYVDKETGMYNRTAFQIIVTNKLEKKKPFRIIELKLIGFKYLNTTIGVSYKEEMMKEMAFNLRKACEKRMMFRISGTRIAVIIPDNEKLLQHYIIRINAIFSEPVKIGDYKIVVTSRLVHIRCPEDANTWEDVSDILEVSLDNLIEAEPQTVEPADKKLLQKSRRSYLIQNLLSSAIENNEFYVVYQPIYSFEKQRYTTAEALVRLNSEKLGFVGPDEFIPIAEQNGMILKLGEFVFKSVCEFIIKERLWEKGIEYIHVNLSAIQCMQKSLNQQLISIMDSYGLDYKYIALEVTETAAKASSNILQYNMNKLVERNMIFALDDYGTGFSNIESLIKYPFKTIKLDKSLVDTAFSNIKTKIILQQTITMIKELGLDVVAEGVETESQKDELEKMLCDYIQGYYFSKPVKRNAFLELLDDIHI